MRKAKKLGVLANWIPELLPASTLVLSAVHVAPPVKLQLDMVIFETVAEPENLDKLNCVLPELELFDRTAPLKAPLVFNVPTVMVSPPLTFIP